MAIVMAVSAVGCDECKQATGQCCKVCRDSKACGDSCINVNLTCRQGPGCACNAWVPSSPGIIGTYATWMNLWMVDAMDAAGFGNCTNHYECEAACPKSISVAFIARMNRDYLAALAPGLANRG